MKRSLNEIGGMVLKAARGAGIPLGHCDDMAIAAIYLAATDPIRLDCVIDALSGEHAPCSIVVDNDEACIQGARAAMAGPAAVDAINAGLRTVVFRDLDAPRIVLALIAAHRLRVDHRFEGGDLIVNALAGNAPMPPGHGHITVSAALWNGLGAFAANTYVPASDASRRAGAGANLNDND